MSACTKDDIFHPLKFICVLAGRDPDPHNIGIVVTVHATGPQHVQHQPGGAQLVGEGPMVARVVPHHQECLLVP